MAFRVFTRSSAFVTIALLIGIIHIPAQVPEAAAPGGDGEHCSHGSHGEPRNVQELTSTSSTPFHTNQQHGGGNALSDEPARHRSEQLPLAEQPQENWMQVKEDAVFELELLLRQLVQVREPELAGEIAWQLRLRLETPREDELEDRCFIGASYQAIDVCIRYSLRHRPRGGVNIPMEWMTTVEMLEQRVLDAAQARVRNYHRANAAEQRRKEEIRKRQPPASRKPENDEDQERMNKKRKEVRDSEASPQPEDQDDFSSLVATTNDRATSRTPRRSTASRPTVTESAVWLTPAGALHQPPPATSGAASSTGPTTTDEAINMWHELLGFAESPTESLPTVIPEHMQEAIQQAVRNMPPRPLGILRRSLPLSLNAVQEEVMELLRMETVNRGGPRCASERTTGAERRDDETGAEPSTTRPRHRNEQSEDRGRTPRDDTGGEPGEVAEEVENVDDDTVQVEVEESDEAESDSTMWFQLEVSVMMSENDGEGLEHQDESSFVQAPAHGGASTSSSSSENSTSSSSTQVDNSPEAEQEAWNRHRRHDPEPVRNDHYKMDAHVRRQLWWSTAVDEVLSASPDGRVDLTVWESVAKAVQLRQSEAYGKFADSLMNFIGGNLRFESSADPQGANTNEQMRAALDMEERLWRMYAEGDTGLPRNLPRRSQWRVNNKPSYELPHPMGVVAAQGVEGNRYWCRCVKLPNGEIIAVRENDREPVMEEGEETDELGMMQRTPDETSGATKSKPHRSPGAQLSPEQLERGRGCETSESPISPADPPLRDRGLQSRQTT